MRSKPVSPQLSAAPSRTSRGVREVVLDRRTQWSNLRIRNGRDAFSIVRRGRGVLAPLAAALPERIAGPRY
jgi:hypothetical protein